MKFTREELEVMPLHLLKNRDITNAQEEALVQEVLNSRNYENPPMFKVDIPSSVTDRLTRDTELELQAKIDADREAHRAQYATPTVEVEEEPIAEPEAPVEAQPEALPVEETPPEPELIVKKKRGRPAKVAA